MMNENFWLGFEKTAENMRFLSGAWHQALNAEQLAIRETARKARLAQQGSKIPMWKQNKLNAKPTPKPPVQPPVQSANMTAPKPSTASPSSSQAAINKNQPAKQGTFSDKSPNNPWVEPKRAVKLDSDYSIGPKQQ